MKPLSLALLFALIAAGPAGGQTVEHLTSSAETREALVELIASDDRSERQVARDKYRRPLETLTFFGIEPHMTVVEVWPGGQGSWYRAIIEPLFEGAEGRYIPISGGSDFPDQVDDVPYGEVDLVMVFRAHGFMIYDAPAQDHVDALFAMLRPGGILGIVDHAGDEAVLQDPDANSGYVNESHFFAIAKRAGFRILAASDHNRNPADDKDHPRGVYSLPPSLSGTRNDPEARVGFQEIGESDRFTHKYYKPPAE